MKSKRWGVRVAEPENTVPPAPTAPPLVWHQVGISLLCSWKNRKSLDRLSPSLRHACPQPHHFPWNPLDWDTELGSGSTDCATQGARKPFCSGQGMRLQITCSQPCSLPTSCTWKPSAIDIADIILTIASTIIKPVNISAWGTIGLGCKRVGQGWLSIPTLLKEVRISRGT